jgi:hypothetical protein
MSAGDEILLLAVAVWIWIIDWSYCRVIPKDEHQQPYQVSYSYQVPYCYQVRLQYPVTTRLGTGTFKYNTSIGTAVGTYLQLYLVTGTVGNHRLMPKSTVATNLT